MSATTLDILLKLSGVPVQTFYGTTDATKILHVPHASILRLIRTKKLPAVVVNRKNKLIRHEELAAFVANAAGNVSPANDEHRA